METAAKLELLLWKISTFQNRSPWNYKSPKFKESANYWKLENSNFRLITLFIVLLHFFLDLYNFKKICIYSIYIYTRNFNFNLWCVNFKCPYEPRCRAFYLFNFSKSWKRGCDVTNMWNKVELNELKYILKI